MENMEIYIYETFLKSSASLCVCVCVYTLTCLKRISRLSPSIAQEYLDHTDQDGPKSAVY